MYYNVDDDLSGCTWAKGQLVDIPMTQPEGERDRLLAALRRAPREHTIPFDDLGHFNTIKTLVETYVKKNKSVAIVRADNTVTILRDDSLDPDFAKKLLSGESFVRLNDMKEGSAFFDPTKFIAWAAEDLSLIHI